MKNFLEDNMHVVSAIERGDEPIFMVDGLNWAHSAQDKCMQLQSVFVQGRPFVQPLMIDAIGTMAVIGGEEYFDGVLEYERTKPAARPFISPSARAALAAAARPAASPMPSPPTVPQGAATGGRREGADEGVEEEADEGTPRTPVTTERAAGKKKKQRIIVDGRLLEVSPTTAHRIRMAQQFGNDDDSDIDVTVYDSDDSDAEASAAARANRNGNRKRKAT